MPKILSLVPTESALNSIDTESQTIQNDTAPDGATSMTTDDHLNPVAKNFENSHTSLLQRSMWTRNAQSIVLEYLNNTDRLSLTATCRGWSALRSDATPWKAHCKLVLRPTTHMKLFQNIDSLRLKSAVSLNVPVDLNISTLTIKDITFKRILCALAQEKSRIKALTLNTSELSTEGFDSFQHLYMLSQLESTELNLRSLQALATCKYLSSLSTLNFFSNYMGNTGIQVIADSVNLRALTTLRLGFNCIGVVGARAIANSENLRSLTILDLSNNSIGAGGVRALADSANVCSLITLDLFSNEIKDEGVRSLAESVNLTALVSLFLGDNGISDAGAQTIANSINWKDLATLTLECNEISDAGAQAIASAKHLNSLNNLHLHWNGICPEMKEILQQNYPNCHIAL